MKLLKYVSLLLTITMGSFLFVACSDNSSGGDEPKLPDETPDDAEGGRLILIYAVADNNLNSFLRADSLEMVMAGPKLNLKDNKLLLYSVNSKYECKLQQLVKDGVSGKYRFETIGTFPSEPVSTSKTRISEVMGYVKENFDYPYMGLVLWSHASGWVYWPQDEDDDDVSRRRAFGMDNYNGTTYETNITTLANAIPDDMFDFIWFDCCYMANIETVYQLRKKTDKIVASVMEISSPGAPYDMILPSLLKKDANLTEAAEKFFNYYNSGYSGYAAIASISVMDTRHLEDLAAAASTIYMNYPSPQNIASLQNYSRYTQNVDGVKMSFPFYDLGQYLFSCPGVGGETAFNLRDALDETIVYKAITEKDFKYQRIDLDAYSGLSVHHYTGSGPYDDFYRELDWFKDTRMP